MKTNLFYTIILAAAIVALAAFFSAAFLFQGTFLAVVFICLGVLSFVGCVTFVAENCDYYAEKIEKVTNFMFG
jgi:hypothetical protein